MHNARWNTIPVCYVAIKNENLKQFVRVFLGLILKLWFIRVFANTLKSKNI